MSTEYLSQAHCWVGSQGSVVSKLPMEPVLVEVTVSRRLQAMSKGVMKEVTRHKF